MLRKKLAQRKKMKKKPKFYFCTASKPHMWSKIIQIPNVAGVEIKLTMQCGFKVVIYCIILLIWKANHLLLAELLRSFLDKLGQGGKVPSSSGLV